MSDLKFMRNVFAHYILPVLSERSLLRDVGTVYIGPPIPNAPLIGASWKVATCYIETIGRIPNTTSHTSYKHSTHSSTINSVSIRRIPNS